MIPSRIFTTAIFIGMAREVCEVFSDVITLCSLQFEHRLISDFLTSYEMKELASRAFLISFEKSISKYGSSALFNLEDSSLTVTTAFLLKVDLKL